MEFPSEDKEIKITRIVTQSGQSKYKINDKPRTRQQILDLMGIAKINPDGYNIVLQGDIINFCNMSTVDRRMMIEDISGIGVYEEKKNHALLDLNKVETNIREADLILAERKNYLKDLKKDRDQALKYKEMSENVNSNKATLLHLQISKRKKENEELVKEMEELKGDITKYEADISKIKEENNKRKEEIEHINKEIEEKGEKEQVEINKQVEQLKIEITKNKSRVSHLQSELLKIDQREKDLKSSLGDIQGKVDDVVQRREDLLKEKKKLSEEKDMIENKIVSFKKKHNLESAGDIDKEIDSYDKKLEEMQKTVLQYREKQQELIRRKDNLEFQLNTIDQNLTKITELEKEHKSEIDKIKQKREEFKKTTLELNELLNEDSKLSALLVNGRKKLVEMNEKLAELRLKENAIQHNINADMAIKKILELKDKKRGIYDTVAELGNVAPEFTMALEVAAGIRIKSIVVEDDKVAAECIKYLKQNKLGFATFLPLNKIRGPEVQEDLKKILKEKGVRGYATDLIEYDSKFKNVFSYVFGNTIVVDNIDVAREIGIGRCKMVTMDGDYCDVSGSMQGGFRSKKRDGFGFKDDSVIKEVRAQEADVDELTGNISLYEKQKAALEEKIIRMRNFRAELEGDIIKTERALHLGDTDLDSTMKSRKDLQKENDDVDKEMRELQNTITKTNTEFAQNKIKRQQLKDQVTMLRAPTLIAELNTFEQKKAELNEFLIKLDSEVSSLESQQNAMFASEKQNIDKLVKQLEKEKVDFAEETKQLGAVIKTQEKHLEEKEAIAKKFYQQFKELFNKRSKINDEVNANELKINGKQQKSRELEIKLNTLSLGNAKIMAELSGLEQEYKQYENVPLLSEKDEEVLKREIYRFEKMKEEIGNVNMRALEMYDQIEKEYNSLLEKKDTLEKERVDVLKMIEEIDKNKKELFMKNYSVINENFQKIFLSLSTKGEAFLELENETDPFEGGVIVKVRITGNKFMDIKSLSGGEKTMTALAFIFAIQEHDPAEFYIMDEVDAALDKKNSEKLSELIQKYCDRAQYIIISHNDGVISKADTLFGISMDENGISKATSLKI
jgi:chromosome segregation protein